MTRRWLLTWALLTAVSVAINLALRLHIVAEPWFLTRVLNNAILIVTLPGWIIVRLCSRVLGTPSSHLFATALGWGVFLVCVYLALRVRRAIMNIPSQTPDPGRRRFLFNATATALVLPPSGVAAAAIAHQPWSIRVARYTLTIRGFGRDMGEFRVVNVTDTHLGTRIPASFIERAYELAGSLEPDFAILTGDFLYNDISQLQRSADLASQFAVSARIASFGVLGNHDWYLNGPRMRDALTDAGVIMLDNTQRLVDLHTRTLTNDMTPTCLRFSGLGDLQTDQTLPGPALMVRAKGAPTILLAHQPDTAEHGAVIGACRSGARVDLQLAGHTHGGQVWVPLFGTPVIPSRFGQKYAHGMVRGPQFPVLISAGIGMSILPVRWRVPPEVVLLTIDCCA